MTGSSENESNITQCSVKSTVLGIPREFVTRRLHSLSGIFLILFLIEHLLTNSQAALWISDEGRGFIEAVNFLHSLPYLQSIEFFFLCIPFLIHGIWGVRAFREAQINSSSTDGSRPFFRYPRNLAFTWQRVTAILLAIGLIWHVVSMRFCKYPEKVGSGENTTYAVSTTPDCGVSSVAARLNAELITEETKPSILNALRGQKEAHTDALQTLREPLNTNEYERIRYNRVVLDEKLSFIEKLQPSSDRWYVLSPHFGTATLFTVRDVFKSYLVCVFYTLFVLSACFHAGNGLWTAAISWGISVNQRSRTLVQWVSYGLMAILAVWGLAAIWLTYFVTLRQ